MLPQSWIDKTIGGRYKIDSLLGHGGMSAVYRATDPNLRRMVAIKLIHPHLSVDPNFVNRFKEEAAAVARLRHPNIVQVHDFDIDGETYYMVMEYLVGETLQARLKRLNAAQRNMPSLEAINICTQICDAVGYAHNHELIHRDLKPANIMLDVNGQAILMDFGIVKIVGGEYHTATGATIGTAMYMSPEQIRSERADDRSDIYSLGVTLYEMLSGQTPYQADSTVTLMMMVLNDPLPDLQEVRQGIPESLAAVAKKALAKDKKDRFQTMEEMAAALQRSQGQMAGIPPVVTVVDDEPVEGASLPETQVDELVEGASPPDTQIDEPVEGVSTPDTQIDEPVETSEAPTELDSAEALERQELEGEATLPELTRDEGMVSTLPTVSDQPVDPLSAPEQDAPSLVREKARPSYRRYVIIAAIVLLIGVIAAAGYFYITSQRAPDLQLAAIDQPSVPINAQTAPSVVSLGMWETSSYIEELDYSPDGKLLGTANNRDTMPFSPFDFYGSLLGVDTGSLQDNLTGHTQWVYSAAFSPDGQLFATASDDANVLLWQVSDGSLAREIETSTSGITNVDFSPNNLLLATASWDGDVGVWQLSDGHLLRTLQGHEDGARDVEFSPDGELLASASDDQTIRLWQVSDGNLMHTLQGHTGYVHKLAFSPDGTLLASASEDNTIGIWQVSEGSLVRSLEGHSEPVLDVAFSPDGSLLVSGSGDGTLRFWRVVDGEMLLINTEYDETITSVAFSPDGHILVSAAADGVLRFWGLSEAIPLETETPTEIPLTGTELPVSTPNSETSQQATTPAPALLAASGPWAVFSNDQGMWLSNTDGSALTNLVAEPVEAVYDLHSAVSPDGRYLAFLTATETFHDLTLHMIALPDGQAVLQLPLTSRQTEPGADAIQGDPKLEIASAISLPENPVWSPDGRWVAFMGAQEGPTSDLYIYSLDSGEITQLTDGISQGIKPTWSPDGRFIVHSGVSTLGTGAGYALDAVWAAPVDGSEVRTLYRPDSGDEIWLGWADAETLLVYSWSASCEGYNLRAVNVSTGETRPIFESNFLTAALDPASGNVALAVKETYPKCGDEAAAGLYLIPPGDQGAIQVAAEGEVEIDRLSELEWSEAHEQFLLGTEDGLIAISLSGQLSQLPAPGANSPVLSPDGGMLAWRFTSLQESVGVWVAEWDTEPRQIYDQHTGWALWMDDTSLLFIGSDGLYLAREPDYEPVLVQPDFWASGMALSGRGRQ
jgi:serine/threonine protein kinase/WD40 repeat protein